MKETHATRALLLSLVVLLSVTTAPVLGTTVSKTTISDPGTSAPFPGDTQTVLDLTISSDDLVKTSGDGSAGDPTASFNDGTTNTPEMYVDDSTSGGYQDGDDVLRLNRLYPSSGGGLGGATIADFSTSESYISPAGNAFDGSQAIVDSGDGTLDSAAEIDKNGTAGVLTGLAGTNIQFHEDAAGGAGYDAVNNAYGEAIYNTGGDGTVDGTDTRVTAVTVNSGTDDGDVGTVDLGLSTLNVVGSADVDTGKKLTAAGITPVVAYIEASGDASFSTGDTVVIDMTGNGQTSDDIILVDNGGFTGGGDAYTGTLTGAWDTIDASSVAFDNGNDGAASVVKPDVVISGGTATIVTAGVTYGVDVETTNGPVIQYWDIDGNNALGSTESVYIDEDDTGNVSSDDANPSDFRLRGFSKTLPAGAVGSTDVDAGISATDFETDEYYLDDDDTGPYANGDAIIVNGGTAANLEAADNVVVTGSISGSARTFSDGTSGDAVMFVGTNDFDGSQDILGVTRVVNGGSDTALSGTTLNNFANDVGYVDTANLGSFDAAETIFQEGDASSGLGTIFGDTVTDITVTNKGTLGTQNISSVSLDIGGTDITSTSSASNGVYAFTGITNNNIVGTGGTSATVTVTLSHDAPAGKTLNFSVSTVADAGTTGTYDSGDSGMFFEQAAPVGDISNGADITIDSTKPDLLAAETDDENGDGTVDEITATFSESVNDSSVSTGDFSLSAGSVESVSTGATTDDDTIVLTVSGLPTGDTSATPDVTLLADSVTDLAGNTGPSTDTTVTASDGASPVMLSAVTGDADGDGHLDRVTLTYSEGVTPASTNVGDYDIGGATYEGESIVTDDDGDAILGFGVIELGTFDSGATPNVAFAQGTTADTAGNLALSQTVTATDGAAPIANSLTLESTPISDSETGNGNEVTVTVTFDEDMDQTPGDVTVTPDVNGDLSTAPTVENKRWTDAQTFKADIQFTDDDEAVSGIRLEVSTAKDTAGNRMSSAVSTSYDVDTTNPSSVSGGSSISTEYLIVEQDTESTTDGGSMEVTISGYVIGDTISVPTENIETDSFAVEEVSVSFDMGTNVPNEMTIRAGTEPPAAVPEYGDAEQTDYVSVDIEGNLADRVTDGLITVRVSADRMPSDPSAVSIYHFKGDSWDKTNTKYLGDRRYKIYTSSFSTFVVVVEDMTEPTTPQSTTPTTTVTEMPPTSPQSTTPTTTVTETPPTTETSTLTSTRTETPGFGIAISLFAFVGAGLLVVYRRRE